MRILRQLLRLLSNSLRPCLVLAGLCSPAFGVVELNQIEVVEVAGKVVQVDERGVNPVVEAGAKIRRKAKVRIGTEGRLVLALSNGARVLVEADSSFAIHTFVDSSSKGSLVDLRPETGRYAIALPRQGPGDVFVVRTAEGERQLQARGLYHLNLSPDASQQQFLCLSGEGLFMPSKLGRGPVRVKAGEVLSLTVEGDVLTTSLEPINAHARRMILEQLAYEREFKVYPLDQPPSSAAVSASSGGGGTAALSAVLARVEDVVERETQTNPSPTGG